MMMNGWNFSHIIFLCLLSGYHLVVRVESIFPKTQPVYTDSFLPAAIQVTQHLIDKIDEVIENPPDPVTPTSTTTDTSFVTVTVSSTSPTTANVSSTTTNIPLTTTNMPPASSTVSLITTNVSPKTTVTLPVVKASASQLQNNESPLETMTKSESILVSVTPEQTNSQNMNNCPSSVSLISDHTTYISETAPYHEYSVLNGTVNEGFIKSVLKQNASDKMHTITNSSTHKNESVQYMIATMLLSRLRDVLALEAKRQGMSKIQGYSTELLELLASTSKMSSSNQLSFILKNMLRNGNAKLSESIEQSRIALKFLGRRQSSLSIVLTHIPAFQYT